MKENIYCFTGRIVGADPGILIKDMAFTTAVGRDHKETFSWVLTIVRSDITVCITEADESTDLWVIKTHVQRMVFLVVASYGAACGTGLEVDLQTVTTRRNTTGSFSEPVSDLSFADSVATRLRELVAGDPNQNSHIPYLRRAVLDHMRALRDPQEAFTLCFRAIEAIRLYFKDTNPDGEEPWKTLKKKLKIDPQPNEPTANYETFRVGWLTTKSKAARHGVSGVLSKEEYRMALQASKTAIERFVWYDPLTSGLTADFGYLTRESSHAKTEEIANTTSRNYQNLAYGGKITNRCHTP